MHDLDDSEAPSDFQKHEPVPPLRTDLTSSLNSPSPSAEQDIPTIGHRLNAGRSVLALAVDEESVYAGLQGGDILVRNAP